MVACRTVVRSSQSPGKCARDSVTGRSHHGHITSRIRLRSRSKLARPYIWRFEHLDAVDVALDRARAVRQAQAVDHGVQVALEPGGEGVEVRELVGLHSGDPHALIRPSVRSAALSKWCDTDGSPSFEVITHSPRRGWHSRATTNPRSRDAKVGANDAAGFASRYGPLSCFPNGAFDAGLRPGPFPDRAASLLPGLLAAIRTGLHRLATTSFRSGHYRWTITS
jgi:hypothetical protein